MGPDNSPSICVSVVDMIISLVFNTTTIFFIKAVRYNKSVVCCVPINHISLAGMKSFLGPTGNQKQVAVMLLNELENLRKLVGKMKTMRKTAKLGHLLSAQRKKSRASAVTANAPVVC